MAFPDYKRDSVAALRRFPWLGVGAALLLIMTASACAEEGGPETAPPLGSAKLEWDVGGTRLEVFTYKPRITRMVRCCLSFMD
jgi:hypothetical protein